MNLEQATDLRLQQIADLVHSGVTEMTGKSRRAGGFGEGEFIGRFGGLKPMYPELNALKESPSQITAAIDRGSGKTYDRVRAVVKERMEREGYKERRKYEAKKTIPPHSGRVYCRHCATFHTKGQHRFHGPGSYLQTHLFPFKNPMTHKEAKKLFSEIMEGLRRGLHLSPEGRAVFEQAKAKLRQYRKPVMRNAKRNVSPRLQRLTAVRMRKRLENAGIFYVQGMGWPQRVWDKGMVRIIWHHSPEAAYKAMRKEIVPILPREQRSAGRNSRLSARTNPGGLKDINGGAVYDVTYQKRGPHRCDAECREFNHMYRHDFKTHPPISGTDRRTVVDKGKLVIG